MRDTKGIRTPSEALDYLAAELLWKMEHLDPTYESPTWESLNDQEKEFYRQCVKAITRHKRLVELIIFD